MSDPTVLVKSGWVRSGLYIVPGLLVLYLGLPLLPIVYVDGDDAATAAGALQLSLYGQEEHDLVYVYVFQPGTYVILVALHKLLGVHPQFGLWLLTVGGVGIFLVAGATFVGKIAAIHPALAVLVLLLFQETWSSAYFSNTSMFGAGLLCVALLSCLHRSLPAAIASGLVFAIAIWTRIDVMLVALAFPALMLHRDRSSVIRLAAFSGTLLLALVSLFLLAGVPLDPEELRYLYGYHAEHEYHPWLTLVAYLTVFTGVVCLLGTLGLASLVRSRRVRVLLACAAGTLPLFLAYGTAVTTPRYFLCSLPFVAIPASVGLRYLLAEPKKILRVGAVALFLAQYVLNFWALLPVNAFQWTYEGPRFLGSIVRSPYVWANFKRVRFDGSESAKAFLREFLENKEEAVLVAWNYPEREFLKLFFLTEGYRCSNSDYFEGNSLWYFERADRGQPVLVVTLNIPLDELPPAVADRLSLETRRSVLYFGSPRETPRLFHSPARVWRVSQHPEVFRVVPGRR